MRVYIPTKGRPPSANDTYDCIRKAGRDLLRRYAVTMVVETEEEVDKFFRNGQHCIVSGVSGIGPARQWILDNSPDNKVVMLDDDLSSWAMRNLDGRFTKNIDAPRVALEWMEQALGHHAHAGIGHRQFANNKPIEMYNDRMLRAVGYRKDLLDHIGARYTFPLMEDFEMTLKLLTRGLENIIYYGVVQDQVKSGAPGGCSGMRTPELQEKCARALHAMFPDFVTLKYTESGGMGYRLDVSVQWKKAYKYGLKRGVI